MLRIMATIVAILHAFDVNSVDCFLNSFYEFVFTITTFAFHIFGQHTPKQKKRKDFSLYFEYTDGKSGLNVKKWYTHNTKLSNPTNRMVCSMFLCYCY